MRAEGPGWVLCSMLDPAGRRGLWLRPTYQREGLLERLEICAGREGDDYFVDLRPGEAIDLPALHELEGAINTGSWLIGQAHDSDRDHELSPLETAAEHVARLVAEPIATWRADVVRAAVKHLQVVARAAAGFP